MSAHHSPSRFFARGFAFLCLFLLIIVVSGVSFAEQSAGEILPANAIIGGNANDKIGTNLGGNAVVELPNGNLVISSQEWNGGRGAVTCLTPSEYQTGNIVISAANSVVGDSAGDYVGHFGITVLANGDFVIKSPVWDDGGTLNVGAITWVDGTTCIPFGESTKNAVVSASNSLIGSSSNDGIGNNVLVLTNGNYVISSSNWDNPGVAADVGAVVWVDGDTGLVGVVSSANALIGATASDRIGSMGVVEVGDSNYVVNSALWDNGAVLDAGAITWVDGDTGLVGTVSTANSLVGSTSGDQIGSHTIFRPNSGNYVVVSPAWDNGGIVDAGAVTWADAAIGIVGAVSASNSLVGSNTDDSVGSASIASVGTNKYVVLSPAWDNGGIANAGAVTWADGATGVVGAVSTANSLVGDTANDQIGNITILTNNNYVITSTTWHGNRGAATWVDGNTGLIGVVSAANSLVGSIVDDFLGLGAIEALSNGNYVVISPLWDNGGQPMSARSHGGMDWVAQLANFRLPTP